MTIIQTRNTRYELRDLGDGAFFIRGHAHYCPTSTRVRLTYSPRLDYPLQWEYLDAKDLAIHRRYCATSAVVSITEES